MPILLYMYIIHVIIHHTIGLELQSTTNGMVLPFTGGSGEYELTEGANGCSLDNRPILYRFSAQLKNSNNCSIHLCILFVTNTG